MEKSRILLVEDNRSLGESLSKLLRSEGYDVIRTETAEEALLTVSKEQFDLILTDLLLPKLSGVDLLRRLQQDNICVPSMMMTAYGTIDIALESGKLGVSDFIQKPFEPELLLEKVRIVLGNLRLAETDATKMLGKTDNGTMQELLRHARKVASLPSSVLIFGESGTGKELLARYIHQNSPRKDRAFLAINCGALPEALLESELFGYEAGAFTGATQRRAGLFEEAEGGTVLLDEIGNMPTSLQMKLLRTLQESEVRLVGGVRNTAIDVRVIAATNCQLQEEIRSGRFRDDLFYRLSVVELTLPPLRERREDIPALAKYFVERYCREFNRMPLPITPSGLEKLERYDWPGNIRELENAIQRAVIFANGPLTPLSFDLRDPFEQASSHQGSLHSLTSEASKRAEVKALLNVLAQTRGNKVQAAKMLGVSYKTLLNKVREHELDVDFKATVS